MPAPKVVNPPASLEPRDSDVGLLPQQFLHVGFFGQLKKAPDVEKFPGTLLLRFFKKGEVICRQGEAGWSAFYALPDADALKVLREFQASGVRRKEKFRIDAEIARLEAQTVTGEQQAADVYLAVPRPQETSQQSWIDRLFRSTKVPSKQRPLYIPIDGPTDISYETRQAALRDGELFGEMSSLYGTPRSATVVASRDIYVLEMLRNILDEVKRDPAFQKRMDDVYKARVLQVHLANLPIFRDLPEEQLARVRDSVELVRFKDGDVICDENEPSDSMYIIRSGLVKVLKHATSLLAPGDVADWARLTTLLREAGQAAAVGPRAALWKLLPEAVRALLSRDAALAPDEQRVVVNGLNEIIKKRELPDLKDLQPLATLPRLAVLRQELPKKTAEWPALDLRQFNRLLLEEALPEALVGLRRSKGPQSVLAFLGRGDYFGEMGLILKQPRFASCVAYVHPLPETPGSPPVWLRQGELVEMVRLPEKTFWELANAFPTLRTAIEIEIARRQKQNIKRLGERTWDDASQVLLSDRFSELGLVQGQKLMLIDLERCTRCDECVQACVNSHDDGRARLFLDGPRFGKYLVPTSCRSCLEPVCMIGCPVGSIHRGDNRQMVIENWCIGCGVCARNCPYGAIQMHDIGIIPYGAYGWKFQRADALRDPSWTRPNRAGAGWRMGKAPFFNDADLHTQLGGGKAEPPGEQAICFRLEFQLDWQTLAEAREFALEVISTDETASVWINGQEIETEEKAKRGVRPFALPGAAGLLRPGQNVVGVQVKAVPGKQGTLFDLRLDEVRTPVLPAGMVGEYSEKSVTELAVVCDLCSQQYGQRPACVTACPHDAAMRVDARFEFPVQ